MAATEDFHTAAQLAIRLEASSVTLIRMAEPMSFPFLKERDPSYLRELHWPHQMELSLCHERTSLRLVAGLHFPLPPETSMVMASWTWPLSPLMLFGTLAS